MCLWLLDATVSAWLSDFPFEWFVHVRNVGLIGKCLHFLLDVQMWA